MRILHMIQQYITGYKGPSTRLTSRHCMIAFPECQYSEGRIRNTTSLEIRIVSSDLRRHCPERIALANLSVLPIC